MDTRPRYPASLASKATSGIHNTTWMTALTPRVSDLHACWLFWRGYFPALLSGVGRRTRAISLGPTFVAIYCSQGARDIRCARARYPNRKFRIRQVHRSLEWPANSASRNMGASFPCPRQGRPRTAVNFRHSRGRGRKTIGSVARRSIVFRGGRVYVPAQVDSSNRKCRVHCRARRFSFGSGFWRTQ